MSTHHGEAPESYDTAESWDARYGEVEQRWSGRANSALVDLVSDLPPGRVLDVGCGEGADAIWLAARGWDVTALDISGVAIARAREKAGDLPVTWVVADLAENPPPGPFDLVSLQYPALRKDSADGSLLGTILGLVAPGGRLLVVGHDLAAVRAHNRLPEGMDPDDYLLPADFAAAVDAGWTVETRGLRPRRQPPGYDGPDIPDDVLLSRRD
ncbi:class I SAM-dependent methyltransferase [Sporichthya polymorpha]|uniref:class I SAM-dependent methyltransferase n=1 Tax=Sporichthya polymorpha TaxID=35751 RepID=UPI00036CDA65|nr:class I SAM-dependent methyltransferase [Sporichthya polymorpha]